MQGVHPHENRAYYWRLYQARSLSCQFQKVAGFADVAGARFAHLDGGALGFMDVAAEEVFRLVFFDEIANGRGSGVEAGPDLIQSRAVRRPVTNQDKGREPGK